VIVLTKYLYTVEDFYKAYGDPEFAESIISKADDPILTTTTGVYYGVIGAKIWVQLNTENNITALFKKEKWGPANGWRVVTAFASAKITAVSENGTLPDATKYTAQIIKNRVKIVATRFTASMREQLEAQRGQAISWEDTVELMGTQHKLGIAEALAEVANSSSYTAGTDITPLALIVSSYSEYTNCSDVNVGVVYGDGGSNSIDRTSAASALDAIVLHNSGTLRALTVNLINTLVENVMRNCGDFNPKNYVFLTGTDTLQRWSELVGGIQRLPEQTFNVDMKGGIRYVPGGGGGFQLRTYRGIPIVTSQHLTLKQQPTGGLTPIYMLHVPSFAIWYDLPTIYEEHGFRKRETILLGRTAEDGMFMTAMDLICFRPFANGKLRDIKAY